MGGYCNEQPGNAERRFYFEPSAGVCLELRFRGLGGNANNFGSREECMRQCAPEPAEAAESTVALAVESAEPTATPSLCSLPPDPGNGEGTLLTCPTTFLFTYYCIF